VKEKLLVFAEPEVRRILSRGLRGICDFEIISLPQGGDWRQSFHRLPATERSREGGILAICRQGASLIDAAPGPCLDGIPVGVVPAEQARDLTPWLNALRLKPARSYHVLAMWKPFYLAWGERFVSALQVGYGSAEATVMAEFADNTTREALCRSLWQGPQLALYLGHGRSRGWSGYRGFRWHHVAAGDQVRPVGALIALTCDNLKPGRNGEAAFGARWVIEGRATAFLGAIQALDIPALEVIAGFLLGHFSSGLCRTLGEIMAAVDGDVGMCADAAIRQNWSHFRLVGNPLQAL
jgi:hypothetical protein